MNNNIIYTKVNENIIGQRLKIRRKLMHMTQKELASTVGVTFQQIQKYEAGINKISLQLLLKFCDVLHCSIDYFIGGANCQQSTYPGSPLSDVSACSAVPDNMEDELLLAFREIKALKVKVAILELVKCLRYKTA